MIFPNHGLGGKKPRVVDSTINGLPVTEQRRRFIKSLIYPDWDNNTFQAIKASDVYNKSEIFHWFYKNHESETYLHAWRSNVQSQLAIVNPDMLATTVSGAKQLIGLYSRHYVVGKLNLQKENNATI